jgi:signal transduction histidine kinase
MIAALEELCADYRKRTGIKVSFLGDEIVETLRDNEKIYIYRIIQECLTNVAKHAQAHTVVIEIVPEGGPETGEGMMLAVNIQDDGIGFSPGLDPSQAGQNGGGKGKGLGLTGIRERVKNLNGTVQFISAPGKGAKVSVHIPID